jgi:hypothetical protein
MDVEHCGILSNILDGPTEAKVQKRMQINIIPVSAELMTPLAWVNV